MTVRSDNTPDNTVAPDDGGNQEIPSCDVGDGSLDNYERIIFDVAREIESREQQPSSRAGGSCEVVDDKVNPSWRRDKWRQKFRRNRRRLFLKAVWNNVKRHQARREQRRQELISRLRELVANRSPYFT